MSSSDTSVSTGAGSEHAPIVIAGAGPTGLVLAALLARCGVESVVLEKEAAVCGEARAVTIDDESLRTIQNTGLLPDILKDIVQGYGVHYYSWRNQLFAKIEPRVREYGYSKRNAFRQQLLVQSLARQMVASGAARILYEHELISFQQSDTRVALHVRTPLGERTIIADWLIACDGGRSIIRESLGIVLEGATYADKWLIVDMVGHHSDFIHARTFCDPARPAIRLPGPQTTLRYEFMLKPEDDDRAVLEEANIRDWLRRRNPADASLEIVRKVVYTFHARVATRWKQGRVLLAGDAAHLTPPFAGQGMNSGVRDAWNLAWKLAAVTRGRARPGLLDTYEAERKRHAGALIDMALRIGWYMQPKSRLGAAASQTLLRLACMLPAARDYILNLKFKPKPRFHDGLFLREETEGFAIPPGQLMTQPRVELADGRSELLDNLLGSGFAMLRWAHSGAGLAAPKLVDRVVDVIRGDDRFTAAPAGTTLVRDSDGELARVLDAARADAVILRPDRYVLAYLRASDPQSVPHVDALLGNYFA